MANHMIVEPPITDEDTQPSPASNLPDLALHARRIHHARMHVAELQAIYDTEKAEWLEQNRILIETLHDQKHALAQASEQAKEAVLCHYEQTGSIRPHPGFWVNRATGNVYIVDDLGLHLDD